MVRSALFFLIFAVTYATACRAQTEPFMRMEMISRNLYPNSEIVMRLRLYDPTGAIFGEIPLPMITGPGAHDIRRLGIKPKFSAFEYGREYFVLEYHYAIFVTTPGTYRVDPVVFKGTVKGVPIALSAESSSFTVVPQPKGMTGKWRSAHKVDVSSGFNVKSYDTYVGETLRRAIVLKAFGANMAFFPEINLPKVDGMRIYKSPSKKKEELGFTHLELEQRYNYIYIPQKAGEIEIPAYSFDWFDLSTNQVKTITIPKVIFNVGKDKAPSKEGLDGTEISFVFTMDHFYLLMSAVTAGLLLAVLFRKYRKALAYKRGREKLQRQLKAACGRNDAKAALRHALRIIEFAGITGVTNITEVAALFNDVFLCEQAVLINEAIFKNAGGHWSGKAFCQAFTKAMDNHLRKGREPEFPGLYPFS